MSDEERLIKNLNQTWPTPSKLSPIIIIGTGGIVKDAHLPAYKKAGFHVLGLYDVDKIKADKIAKEYKIDKVFNSLDDALENKDCIFDLALPPANLLEVVKKLPDGIIGRITAIINIDPTKESISLLYRYCLIPLEIKIIKIPNNKIYPIKPNSERNSKCI